MKANNNNLLNKLKEKDIARKFELFFGAESTQESNKSEEKAPSISLNPSNSKISSNSNLSKANVQSKNEKNVKSKPQATPATNESDSEENQAIFFNIANQMENTERKQETYSTNQKSDASSVVGDYHLGKPYANDNFQTNSSQQSNREVNFREPDVFQESRIVSPGYREEEKSNRDSLVLNGDISEIALENSLKHSKLYVSSIMCTMLLGNNLKLLIQKQT